KSVRVRRCLRLFACRMRQRRARVCRHCELREQDPEQRNPGKDRTAEGSHWCPIVVIGTGNVTATVVRRAQRLCPARATQLPSETVVDRFRRGYCASAHPAQHDNLVTSLSNASAASFSPSTVLRYGKIMSARSSTVRL